MRKSRRPRGSQSEKPLGRASGWPFYHPGFPGGSDGKEDSLQCRRPRFSTWVGTIPRRRAWQPTPVFLPGESHEQSSLGATVHGVAESNTIEQLNLCTGISGEVVLSVGLTAPSPGLQLTMALPLELQRFPRARYCQLVPPVKDPPRANLY